MYTIQINNTNTILPNIGRYTMSNRSGSDNINTMILNRNELFIKMKEMKWKENKSPRSKVIKERKKDYPYPSVITLFKGHPFTLGDVKEITFDRCRRFLSHSHQKLLEAVSHLSLDFSNNSSLSYATIKSRDTLITSNKH